VYLDARPFQTVVGRCTGAQDRWFSELRLAQASTWRSQLNDSGLDSAFGRHLSQEEEFVRTLVERLHVN